MNRKLNRNRKLSFQQLENRALMTGNVTAVVQNHALVINGDSKGNTLQIVQVGNGQYTVQCWRGDVTTINGHTGPQTFSGITGDFKINLGNGDDLLSIDNGGNSTPTTVPGNLNADMGAGNNGFYLNHAKVVGSASVNAGNGNNYAYLDFSNVGTDCSVTMGKGSNDIFMQGTAVGRDLTLKSNVNQSGATFMDLLAGSIGRNATFQTGNGADSISMSQETIGQKLQINTNGGDDRVVLGGFDTNFIGTIYPPLPVVADQIYLDLGNGNDYLQLGGNGNTFGGGVSANSATYLGGNGDDSVVNHSNSALSGSFSKFEHMPMVIKPLNTVATLGQLEKA